MTTQHAQGPWTCEHAHYNDSHYAVYDEEGNFLTTDDSVHIANARLIAAAPDLLEALEMALTHLEHEASDAEAIECCIYPHSKAYKALEAGRAAIAKAKGETA